MNWKRIRRWAFGLLCLSILTFCGIAWLVGSVLVAPANMEVGFPPSSLSVSSTTIPSNSGSTIAAWYVSAENSHATIILLHPIRGNRRTMLGRAKLFADSGYAVLLIDLQAHGESPGENITVGYLERFDVQAAVSFAKAKNPTHKIGVVGCSLGGAASLLGSPLGIDALVLESVYPSIFEAVENRISMRLGALSSVVTPVLLSQLKPRLGITVDDLRPIDHMADVGCPVLIAGGSLDEHTTLAETRRLFEAAKSPKKLVIFEGAAHVDLLVQNRTLYMNSILDFMNRQLPPASDRAPAFDDAPTPPPKDAKTTSPPRPETSD